MVAKQDDSNIILQFRRLNSNALLVICFALKWKIEQAKNLIVDLAFLLEGKHVESLPEKIMGTIRLNNLDFGESRFVDEPWFNNWSLQRLFKF